MKTKLKCLVAGLVFAAANFALADNPTALNLVKLGDQYVGIQCKDKVVQIRSDKSVGSLTPDIWYVVYYDPDATFKATEVKFGDGQKMDVSRPWRILEMAGGDHRPLDRSKIKLDSDRAIQIATSQDLLKNLKLTATQLWLEHGDEGPQWRVKIWAAKLDNPNRSAYVGTVILSATDGSIIKTDLHLDSVD